MQMIFEDDYMVVIGQPGDIVDHAVVTFSEMRMRPRGLRIWGGGPLGKLGYPALGFVAKAPNWFPQRSMQAALPAARAFLGDRPEITGYGFSMGAWAVLYYAQSLGMTSTLAFSPQYTINPDLIADQRFSRFFDPDLHADMEVATRSGAPLNLIVADPMDRGDWESAARIRAVIDANVIPLTYTGHGTVRAIASSRSLADILAAVRSRDIQRLRRILSACRRRAEARPVQLAMHAARRHPDWAWRIFEHYPQNFPERNLPAFLFRFRNTRWRELAWRELMRLEASGGPNAGRDAIMAGFLLAMGDAETALTHIRRSIAVSDTNGNRHIERQILRALGSSWGREADLGGNA